MHSILIKKINKIIPVSNEDISLIKSVFKPLNIRKNYNLISEGEYTNKLYYINSGYCKYFQTSESGENITFNIGGPNDLVTNLNSFVNLKKSSYTIRTITSCDLLVVTKKDYDLLYTLFPAWQLFIKHILEQLLISFENKYFGHVAHNAQEKYLKLIKEKPSFIRDLPMREIAAIIGIKPESLSRIKRQIYNIC
jgi:CRP-like cAMP-binding protein